MENLLTTETQSHREMYSFNRNILSGIILDCSIEVHKHLGHGLLESVYELCLCEELARRKVNFKRQVYRPIIYKEKELEADFRIDILVEDEVIIELKSVEKILPVHQAQLLSYLKLADKKLGVLLMFLN